MLTIFAEFLIVLFIIKNCSCQYNAMYEGSESISRPVDPGDDIDEQLVSEFNNWKKTIETSLYLVFQTKLTFVWTEKTNYKLPQLVIWHSWQWLLRVRPSEHQAGVTHGMSPISMKLGQIHGYIEQLKHLKYFGILAFRYRDRPPPWFLVSGRSKILKHIPTKSSTCAGHKIKWFQILLHLRKYRCLISPQ